MKKLSNFLPIILFAGLSIFGYNALSAGQLSFKQFVLLSPAVMIALALAFRPKQPKVQINPAAVTEALGDFAKDAFTDTSAPSQLFQAAVSDYKKNMPKSALSKLNKLSTQCRSDEETYAVAMVSALCLLQDKKYEDVIRQYNKAIVLHPNSKLAYTIGTYQQRMGELKKARSSYQFALDLDPSNIEARASMATAFVASHKYTQALEHAALALELDENHASSLATSAICHGIEGNDLLYTHFTQRAVENGYSETKIKETVKALKKY